MGGVAVGATGGAVSSRLPASVVTCVAFCASSATAAGLIVRVNVVGWATPPHCSCSAGVTGPVADQPEAEPCSGTWPNDGSETVSDPPLEATVIVSCAEGQVAKLQAPPCTDRAAVR